MPSLKDISSDSGGLLQKNISGLGAVLASIQEMVVVAEPNGSIIIANPAAEFVTGMLPLSLVGEKIQEILSIKSEKSDLSKFWKEALAGWQAVEFPPDCSLTQKSGRIVPVRITSTPLYSDEGLYSGVVVAVRDLTEEMRLKRRQYEFLSFVSHQLRQPMGSLRWGLEVLDKEKEKLISEHKDIVRDLLGIVLRFGTFINELIDVSRFEEGKLELKKELIDLEGAIRKSFEDLRLLAESQNLKVTFDKKPKELKPFVIGDGERLKDVLTNLLINAMRYNKPRGSVDVLLEEVGPEAIEKVAKDSLGSGQIGEYLKQAVQKNLVKGKFVLLSVADSGIGIPTEEQQKVFEGFFRGSNVTDKGLQGSGLGLLIVKSIVENLGGRIFFKSTVGAGTCFYLLFPIAKQ